MRVKDVLKENDVGNYNKLMKMKSRKKEKNKKKNEKLSEHDIKELMSHSSYVRHKGAIKQVK